MMGGEGARMKMATLLVTTAMIFASACGGGGGSDSGGTGGSPTAPGAVFVADQFTPGANTVAMAQGTKTGDVVAVKVNLTDTNSVYGMAFEVSFDETKVAYVGYTKGTALEAGGTLTNYQVNGSAQPGRVVVGVSRTGSTATNISGTKTAISLSFRVKDFGNFPIAFENGVVTDAQSTPQPLPGMLWFAGTLQGL